jgi:hypothetical protein
MTNTDELVLILSEPDNEPAAVLVNWPAAASVVSPAAFPTTASKITAIVASAAVRLAQHNCSTAATDPADNLLAIHTRAGEGCRCRKARTSRSRTS